MHEVVPLEQDRLAVAARNRIGETVAEVQCRGVTALAVPDVGADRLAPREDADADGQAERQQAQRGRLRHAEMRWWTWGCWALLLGFAMLAARVVLPMWLSALLGNGLIVLGILIYDQAIFRHVLGRGQPWWLWLGLPVGWALIAWMLDWPQSVAQPDTVILTLRGICWVSG